MATQDTLINNLIFNKVSSSKYKELKKDGLLKDDEFYITPDVIDSEPISGSENTISSGAVFTALETKSDKETTYTKEEVDALIENIDIPELDISGKADKADTYTKSEVDNLISNVSIDESNLLHKTGDEEISDTKTFNGAIKVVGGNFEQDIANNVIQYVDENGNPLVNTIVSGISMQVDADGDGNPETMTACIMYQGLSNYETTQEIVSNNQPGTQDTSSTGMAIFEGEGSAFILGASAKDSETSKLFGLDETSGSKIANYSSGLMRVSVNSKTLDGSIDSNAHLYINTQESEIDMSITNNNNSKTTGIKLKDGVMTFTADTIEGIDVPTKVSELENDSGFITEIPSEYITEDELEAKGYLTEHQDISGKADTSYVNEQLNTKADKATTYTKEEVDAKVSSVYRYKGSVASFSKLPTTNLVIGDVYNITDTGANYAYTGSDWDKLSETIDLTPYATKQEVSDELALKANQSTTYTKSEVDILLDNVKLILDSNIVAVTNANGEVVSSSIKTSELAQLAGITSNIQEQLNHKSTVFMRTWKSE